MTTWPEHAATLRWRWRVGFLVFVAACRVSPTVVPAAGIEADVFYLASPALGGRAAGSRGGDSAAAFIARRYQELGLRGAFASNCAPAIDCPSAFFQFLNLGGLVGRTVHAVIQVSDSTEQSQYVLIGAHYDHIGRSSAQALDPQRGNILHPGADDNASGTAGVLELARRFTAHPARRSILVINFDAEELGLIGSRAFVTHSPV